MGDSVSKCGVKGAASGSCKPSDYQDCDKLGSADLTQLISYNGHGLGTVETGLDRRKFKQPGFKQIKDMDWRKFAAFDGVCKRGRQWFAYRQRQAADSQAVSSAATDSPEKQDVIQWLFDPIEEGMEQLFKGRFEKALEKMGWERTAGLSAAALLGLIIVGRLITWPFRASAKRRKAELKAQVDKVRREETARRMTEVAKQAEIANEAQMRVVRAEAAAQEAIRMARELAAARERTPTPQPVDVLREDTPIPLIPRSGDTAAEGLRIEAERAYSAGRESDKTDPDRNAMIPANVDFNVIDAVLDIKGEPLQKMEHELGREIKTVELKRAAVLAKAFPIEGKTLMEATADYLCIAIEFEKQGAERLSENAFRRAAEYLTKGTVSIEMVSKELAPYKAWFENNEVKTEAYREWYLLKEQRMTLVPGDGVIAAMPARDKMTVEVRPAGIPAGVNARDIQPTGMVRAPEMSRVGEEFTALPQRGVASVTMDVDHERLEIERARRSSVVFMEDGMFSGFSEEDLLGKDKDGRIEWGKGGIPVHADPHYDPAAVMRSALSALETHERYRDLTDTDKAKLADIFASAVVGKRAISGFAGDFYREGRIDRAMLEEGIETARTILGESVSTPRSRGPERRTAESERRERSGSFRDLFTEDEARSARRHVEDALKKGK